MNMPYRLVVFDWEGTLGDALGPILSAVAVEAKALNMGEVDLEEARDYVGFGLVKAVQKLFPQAPMHQHEKLLTAIQIALVKNAANACLFPGAQALLERLSNAGILLAIATNRSQQSLERALLSAGIGHYFITTRTASQVPQKPCPQMLEEIIDDVSVSSKETLMVGDSLTDIEMARFINVDAVGMDFYHQQSDALLLQGALEVFDDYKKLAAFIGLAE